MIATFDKPRLRAIAMIGQRYFAVTTQQGFRVGTIRADRVGFVPVIELEPLHRCETVDDALHAIEKALGVA